MLTILKPIMALFAIAFVMAMYQPRTKDTATQDKWRQRTERSKRKVAQAEQEFIEETNRAKRLASVS